MLIILKKHKIAYNQKIKWIERDRHHRNSVVPTKEKVQEIKLPAYQKRRERIHFKWKKNKTATIPIIKQQYKITYNLKSTLIDLNIGIH